MQCARLTSSTSVMNIQPTPAIALWTGSAWPKPLASSRANYVFVIPVATELDLKKAAASVGEKSIAMLPSKEITATTGYVKGGCSPIGMKKHFTTVIDASAQDLTSLTVSAGKLGLQITLAPQDLAKICEAKFAQLTI